jgi:hypothetical protein
MVFTSVGAPCSAAAACSAQSSQAGEPIRDQGAATPLILPVPVDKRCRGEPMAMSDIICAYCPMGCAAACGPGCVVGFEGRFSCIVLTVQARLG